ncbi:MAG: hypothetical protein IPO86_02220 [Saprospiraceae bacterium]|nr:hypothetical protein [Saprospiraceae bacterium]MBK9726912.1 hypothetical protein [Saprospiraceae bacterium]
MKLKVICDTNIWYDLVAGSVSLDKNRFEYFATGTNIGDLIVSDKLNGNPGEVQLIKDAIKAIEQYSDGFIYDDPYMFAAISLFGVSNDISESQQYQNAFATLLSYAKDEIPGFYGNGLEELQNRKLDFKKHTLDARMQFEQLAASQGKTLTEIQPIIESNIATWLIDNLNILCETNKRHYEIIKWNSVTVFIKTFKKFFLDMNPHQEANANTMIDLLQLLYIDLNNPMIFWTNENKINNKVRNQFGVDSNRILYQDYLEMN